LPTVTCVSRNYSFDRLHHDTFTLLYLHPLRVSLLYDSILLQYTGDLQFNLERLDTYIHYHGTEHLQILRENWSLYTGELVTYEHCYRISYREKLLQNSSPYRHIYRTSHSQRLLKTCSPTNTARELVPCRHHQ